MCAMDEDDLEVDWTLEDEEAWASETERDYYAAPGGLVVPRARRRPPRLEVHKGSNASRVRAAYHRLVQRWHPYVGTEEEAPRREVFRRFRAISEGYLVLTDPERRRIYDDCGFVGLRKSEECYEEPIFEKDRTRATCAERQIG